MSLSLVKRSTHVKPSLFSFLASDFQTFKNMGPKKEFKAKPTAKSEKNKPKGGNAKKEQRAKAKEKEAVRSWNDQFSDFALSVF